MRAAVLVLLLLAGCATSGYRAQARDAINKGNLNVAATLLEQAIQSGDVAAWNDLGVVHQRLGNRERAIQYYTVAARYGDVTAQQNLVNLGQPVPAADLAAQRSQANANNAAAALLLMQATQPRPTINCTTTSAYGIANTTCR